ncbi:MAG: NAD(P)H-dependent oxidoreductase subunit E [Elusimicrobia bacterium]|nr:NAD(P)H-dependent oxidoreductase subunit E [Elusimicrobiota bacterium]
MKKNKTKTTKGSEAGDPRLDRIFKSYEGRARDTVSVLQDIQDVYGYLPEDALRKASVFLGVPLPEIFGVATFYRMFRLNAPGKHTVTACVGTACHVRGVTRVVDELSRTLGVEPGQTTPDGNYSLETVACLGCCAIGPVVVKDGQYHGNVTPQGARKLVEKPARTAEVAK